MSLYVHSLFYILYNITTKNTSVQILEHKLAKQEQN